MNLALRDIRHSLGRFLLTTAGISLLLMVVMGMGGIYRGLIQEATLIIDRARADIWVVQHNTKGPFAEVSKLPRKLEYRLAAVEGVQSAEPFVSHTVQRDFRDSVLRLTIQGLPDNGAWLPLIHGRALQTGIMKCSRTNRQNCPWAQSSSWAKISSPLWGLPRT